MATPYMSEIKIFSFGFAPKNWAVCNGQLLPINQNQALFALLGTSYGGDGRVNFALPDLRGRVPMHTANVSLGVRSGEEIHILSRQEMPAHSHPVYASSPVADQTSPVNNSWAKGASFAGYHPTTNSSMSAGSTSNTGGGQAHENRSPYLVLNYCIALEGLFPSRN